MAREMSVASAGIAVMDQPKAPAYRLVRRPLAAAGAGPATSPATDPAAAGASPATSPAAAEATGRGPSPATNAPTGPAASAPTGAPVGPATSAPAGPVKSGAPRLDQAQQQV